MFACWTCVRRRAVAYLIYMEVVLAFLAISPSTLHASGLNVIHSFSGAYNGDPRAAVVQAADGSFYGTTYYGGAYGNGTVFKVSPGGVETTLYSFGASATDGAHPSAALIQASDGNLYGTTEAGGGAGNGTVFKITPAGTLTVLHSFTGGDGGYSTAALVQASDGDLYGTTSYGGFFGYGTVFKITPGGALTSLYSFSRSDGSEPASALIQASDGNFYGTTSSGGADADGTVFKITPGGTLTTLYSFVWPVDSPRAALVQAGDGDLYGTTYGALGNVASYGTVFKITPDGTPTTLHAFRVSDGAHPSSAIIIASDGNFYGTTEQGGANNCGTIFKMTPDGALTTLYSVEASNSDGAYPDASVIQAGDGAIYGTTSIGGAHGAGTAFKIATGGVVTTLHSFGWTDGSNPRAALLLATDGNFYGTTSGMNADWNRIGYGTIFKMTPDGTLTTLHAFAGPDGACPMAAMIQANDGNFYGTTSRNGAHSRGTVFKMTPGGALTTLYSFAGADGAEPWAPLIQASDGNFYGTTHYGGTNGDGTIFKITPGGALTTLYSFAGSDGFQPLSALVQAPDGNFYGTTYAGGAHNEGTIFKMTPGGALTTLYSFDGGPGGYGPHALIQASDANFYGTTEGGGAHYGGTIFRMTPAGVLTTLSSFGWSDGGGPRCALKQTSDGSLYGTAYGGGVFYGGTVFSCQVVLPPTPLGLTAAPGNAQATLNWTASAGATGYTVKRSTVSGSGYATVASPTTNSYTNTGLTNGTTYFFVVSAIGPAGESANSGEASAMPGPPPSPTGLAAVPADQKVSLSWNASPTTIGYRIRRGTVSGGPYGTIATVTSTAWVNTGLTNGVTYYYVVAGINSVGDGPNSAQASATPFAVPPPVPTGLAAKPGNATVTLTWSAAAGATVYRIRRGTVSGTYTTIATVTNTAWANTGLTNGVTYYYVVAAANSAGTSANSTPVSSTQLAPPPAPTGLTATAASGKVALTWNATVGANGYRVRRGTVSGGPYATIASVPGTGWTNTGLANGTTYYYVVASIGAAGDGPNSGQVNAMPH